MRPCIYKQDNPDQRIPGCQLDMDDFVWSPEIQMQS